MTCQERPRAVFFDMDGVLAKYDRSHYDPACGRTPGLAPYLDEGMHCFRHAEKDPLALSLFRECMARGIPAYVLTTVRSALPWARFDKIAWLAEHLPECDRMERLIIADSDKAQAVLAAARMASLNRGMLLLDDYNQNLWDWQAAGGTAVKYLNGVNSPGTFGGPELDSRLFQ